MVYSSIPLLLAALAVQQGNASPTNPASTIRPCVQLEIPVKLSTTATRWLQPMVDSNIDAVDWVAYMTTWSTPNIMERMNGTVVIKDTFKINGQLCVPPQGARADILQLATHGVGYDKRYWDSEIKPEDYSYVDAALADGYSIFTYDRLGTGKSDKPNAYHIVQTSVQVEILRELTLLARSGKLVSSSKKLGGSSDFSRYEPAKVVHVGHSFGSVATALLLMANGTLSDGAILTGFLYNSKLGLNTGVGSWGFEYAPESDPTRFNDRSSGYIVQATKSNVQLQFLKKGTFEPALLDYAEKIKQPATVSEFLSLGAVFNPSPATGFRGPLQFFIGEFDYGFCAGDCKGTYNITYLKGLYPASPSVAVHLQPKTGHGLALSTNATAGYDVIFDFLHSSGL